MQPPCKLPNLFCTRGATGSSQTILPGVELVIVMPAKAVVSKLLVVSGRKVLECQDVRSVRKLIAFSGVPMLDKRSEQGDV